MHIYIYTYTPTSAVCFCAFVSLIPELQGNETKERPNIKVQKTYPIYPASGVYFCHFLSWRIYCSFFRRICLETWFIFIDMISRHIYWCIFVIRKLILGLDASVARMALGDSGVWGFASSPRKGKRPWFMGEDEVLGIGIRMVCETCDRGRMEWKTSARNTAVYYF